MTSAQKVLPDKCRILLCLIIFMKSIYEKQRCVLFDLEHVSPFLFLHRGYIILLVPNIIVGTLYNTIRKPNKIYLAF